MLNRWLLLTLCLSMGAISLHAQDKKEAKEAPKSAVKAKFDELRKDLNKRAMEARKKASEAKDPAEAQKIFTDLLKLDEAKTQFTELALQNEKDEAVIDVISFVVIQLNGDAKKLLPIIEKNHLESDKLVSLVQMFMNGGPPEAKDFLKKLSTGAKSRNVKGFATYAIANMTMEEADGDKAKLEESEKLFDTVAKEYGDVSAGRSTLGAMTKAVLFELRNLVVGKMVPDAKGTRLDGKEESLHAYKGKVVVVDIWATWCGPCRAMIPHEREMVQKMKDKPFALISVSGDDDKNDLEEFLKNEKMPWIHWWNKRGEGIVSDWNIRFFPTIYVIDAKGVIRYKNVRDEQLSEAVEKLVKEAEGQ